jgi:tripartite-type tricarboxylate transporter receptor subunit TctC
MSHLKVKERLAVLGLRPIGSTPAEFKRYVESEIKHYAEIVRLAGIQPQ